MVVLALGEKLHRSFRLDIDRHTGAIETPVGVFRLRETSRQQWVETPTQQQYRWSKRFSNARELRQGGQIDAPSGQLRVVSVRRFGRGRTIEISGGGTQWTARRTGFMRAELADSAGRVLAESRGIRTFADGGLEESVLGLVLLLVYGGVLTMTSRFE